MHPGSRARRRPSLGLAGVLASSIAIVVACSGGGTPEGEGGSPATTAPSGGAVDGGGQTTTPGASEDGGQAPPAPCTKATDCPSGVCNVAKGVCQAPTCTDSVRNGDETDLDCGGTCATCDHGKRCKVGADCASGVCQDKGAGLACQAPSSTDGVKNGTETDLDCGGTGNPACANGKACASRSDCTSLFCKANVCTEPTPADGEQNGDETDIDCGGSSGVRCADALKCLVDADCASDVCKDMADGMGLRCQAPSPTDGKKNGTETDVDCGGAGNPGCAAGRSCLVGGDCASLGCNYAFTCAAGRSCTRHFGGDTCGLGGAGGVGPADWEDCCATADVTPTAGPTKDVAVKLGKYEVTAGRVRAFLEGVGYDVRGFVQRARAENKIPVIPGNAQGRTVLEADWDMYLPTSFAGNQDAGEIADCDQGFWDYQYGVCCENPPPGPGNACPPGTTLSSGRCHYATAPGVCPAGREGIYAGTYTAVSRHLGGTIFRANAQTSTGCFVGAPGTHAFRFPDGQQDGDAPAFDQDVYDTKSMQCIDYLVAQAFCVWDGGRLELLEEWQAAWGPAALPWGASPAPEIVTDNSYWGCRFPWATDASHPDCGRPEWTPARTIEYASYRYSYEYPRNGGNDYIAFISAPGRTRGRGPAGHADLLGNNFELTSNVTYAASPFAARHRWDGSGSWEVHAYNKSGGGNTMLLNKYGKLGLRCAYP